jgi:zinc transport system substrate-binding protein
MVMVAVMTALAAAAWAQTEGAPKLRVAVSIQPMKYFVERVGAGCVQVEALVAPGQNPHTYEATPRQVVAAATAQAYFKIRWPFEDTLLDKIRGMNPKLKVYEATAGITFRALTEDEEEGEDHAGHGHAAEKHDHAKGEPDPHVWLNPRMAKGMAGRIAAGLKELDPARAADYDRNLKAFQAELDALDAKLAAALTPLKGREFMVYHPAFGYFGDAYGLKQRPIELSGKEPSARQLATFIKRARERGVKVIFVQPQFPVRTAETLARSIDGVVTPMDDLAYDYLKNLEDMAAKLTQALDKK